MPVRTTRQRKHKREENEQSLGAGHHRRWSMLVKKKVLGSAQTGAQWIKGFACRSVLLCLRTWQHLRALKCASFTSCLGFLTHRR